MWKAVRIVRPAIHFFRPNHHEDTKHVQSNRDQIAASMEVLKNSACADSFLGRKTYEPFLGEKDEKLT